MQTTTEPILKTYPNVTQSVGITAIMIGAMLILSPANFGLAEILGREASMLLYYVLAMGLTLWIVSAIRGNMTGEISFVLTIKNRRIIPLIVLTTIALLFGIISPLATLIPMPEVFKEGFRNIASYRGVFAFILMVIAAPVFEELIFRGIMLEGLLRKYTPAKSILISSLLFGFGHVNPWQFIAAFVIGVFSGWVYYKTRSVMPSIIIHGAANLCGFSVRLFFADTHSVFDATLFDIYGGVMNLVAIVAGSLIMIWVCVHLLKKELREERVNTPRRGLPD